MSAIDKHEIRLGELNSVPRVSIKPNRQLWLMERLTRVAPNKVERESGVILFKSPQLCMNFFKRYVRLNVQFSLIVINSCVLEQIEPPVVNIGVVPKGSPGDVDGAITIPSSNLHDGRGLEIINDQSYLFIALWHF